MEIVADNIGKFKFGRLDMELTFQDPCRLGRYLGVYDQPRKTISSIPGIEFREMAHNRNGAITIDVMMQANSPHAVIRHQIHRNTSNTPMPAPNNKLTCQAI